MILHPAVIANVIAALVVCLMMVYSSYFGIQIYRYWDLESGSELQLVLERKT
jgi:disulfide bond formation protein DsbB